MPISLSKGQNLSLSKTDPSLKKIIVGLGWDPRRTEGEKFDLDASAFLLADTGKVRSEKDFVFYNQLQSGCGSVVAAGDNRTGQGEGDDEQIRINLEFVPAAVQRIAIVVTIHEAIARKQSFGQVSNAFIRVVNEETNTEIVRYDLSEDYSTETSLIFGEVYHYGGEWKFRAVGQGHSGGLEIMCRQFGVDV
ncbi:TerD family protein [Synechococcus elongatus]|uniref:TerD family protein n=1 Tax=Synechococcus elongatus PCC 11801 TaxID=2219813 RepID=A0AAN1QP94_SYNEL|nr:TerD family protein [Synechococcus elongatus]AZB72861.1 chemical-damaging agent resistance protein C [Synechococcus elongatus PCC 11801]